MFSNQVRKYKTWRVRAAYKKRMKEIMLSLPEILETLNASHKESLLYEKRGRKEDALYWMGRRDGILELFKQ